MQTNPTQREAVEALTNLGFSVARSVGDISRYIVVMPSGTTAVYVLAEDIVEYAQVVGAIRPNV